MSTFGIDGLSSGLDSSSIINQLMQLERQPAVRLQNRTTANNTAITALNSIKTALASVAAAAKALNDPTATFQPRVATSSATHVTATASANAELGSMTFSVDALASRHALSVNGLAATRDEVVNSSGTDQTITIGGTQVVVADGTTLRQLAAQVNAVDGLDITASLVDTGAGIKLQLSHDASGEAGIFTADLTGLDPAAMGGDLGTQILSQGQDATITVGTGGGAYTVNSTTNTFNDLIAGLSFTATAVSTDMVTVSVAGDPQKLADRVTTFVDSVNSALAEMDKHLKPSLDGATPGALAGNSAIRSLRDQLIGSVTYPVAGATLGSGGMVGIQSTRGGKLEFDATKFSAALAADPAAVEALFRTGDVNNPGLAGRVQAKADDATKINTGILATVVTSRETENKSFADQIDRIDRRVEMRRSTLQRQFANLEVVLGQMQAQQAWMASQIGAMNANSAG